MSILMSQRDLSDLEVLKDAEAELHRAADDRAKAAWADRWGEAAIEYLRSMQESIEGSQDWESEI